MLALSDRDRPRAGNPDRSPGHHGASCARVTPPGGPAGAVGFWKVTYDETDTAWRTHWTSPCGQWRVTMSVYSLGIADHYADRYYAMHRTPDGWRRLGVHLRQSAAFRTVEIWIARTVRSAARAAREQEKLARKAERRNNRRLRAAKRQRAASRRNHRHAKQLQLIV